MALKPVTTPDAEAPSIELSIDGQPVQSKAGVSLYDVISQTGKIIPAMCYHYTFDPFGSCGMCLVMVEGKKARIVLGSEALLQQRRPARFGRKSVAGGYAVAQHQHHRRGDGAGARGKRNKKREKQANQQTARHSDSYG